MPISSTALTTPFIKIRIVLVFELASCDLSTFAKRARQHRTPIVAHDFTWHLCLAVHYIHSNRVMHRDLNPRNLLVFESDEGCSMHRILNMSDFGGACRFDDAGQVQTTMSVCTLPYCAPEVLLGLPIMTCPVG